MERASAKQDILDKLSDAITYGGFISEERRRIITEAYAEIERLRAGQFRWIPVSERLPTPRDGDRNECVFVTAGERTPVAVQYKFAGSSEYTHWAPIPPLPEATQEEKDEELWRNDLKCSAYVDDYSRGMAKLGFMAGLKAARGQK